MRKNVRKYLAVLTAVTIFLSGCTPKAADPGNSDEGGANPNKHQNQNKGYTQVKALAQGISWPEGQALPTFSIPAEILKTIKTASISAEERVTFSAFQGLVNKDKTEILLVETGDVDQFTWAKTFAFKREDHSSKGKRYQLLKEYAEKYKGLVLYDSEKSFHYRNAAATIANINGYLPVTQKVRENMAEAGVAFAEDQIIDLTVWTEVTPLDIYTKIYNEYWKQCSKRLLILANPGQKDNSNLDLDHCRDIAAAVGAAVIFLDTAYSKEEKELFEKFVKDMADDNSTSIILGWGITERSAITSSSKYGIGIIPSNYYISASVYSGMAPDIHIPPVPQRKALENKVYIAVYVSDGDNIQYVQRAMRKMWDNEKSQRGKVAINWTVAPSLVDIGPGLLNYYYDSATDLDCFVTGPSGVSYLMPTNTGGGPGEESGVYLDNEKYANDFTSLTETYLERSGIRVVTIWDDASAVVRQSYATNCRYLYGATVQQFGNMPTVRPSVEDNRLHFERLRICYSGDYEWFYNDASSVIENWGRRDRDKPLFLAYQFDRWNTDINDIVKLEKMLNKRFSDQIEFVRADHFYSYYNEQEELPFNLSMLSATSVTASENHESAKNLMDGTPRTEWTGSNGAQITFDFSKDYTISRYLLRHGETGGQDPGGNTRAWKIEYSSDATTWSELDYYQENTAAVTDIQLEEAVTAKYIRITILDAGGDVARLTDAEIYGSSVLPGG